MTARGVEVTYDTIRKLYTRLGLEDARRLGRRQPWAGDEWHL
ncbi:hypothetical protein [Rhodococcus jostii]